MEDFDDDFGDLYADVEVQASSAINCVPEFHRLYMEPEKDDSDSNDNAMNAGPSSKEGFGSAPNNRSSIGDDSAMETTCLEANEENYGSDSEDDLNIVLNDEDCKSKNLLVKGRGNMKNDKDNEVDGYDDDCDNDGIVAGKEFKVFCVC